MSLGVEVDDLDEHLAMLAFTNFATPAHERKRGEGIEPSSVQVEEALEGQDKKWVFRPRTMRLAPEGGGWSNRSFRLLQA